MRVKKRKIVFICQIFEDRVKVAKCMLSHSAKVEGVDVGFATMPPGLDEKGIASELNQIFKKLGYNCHPFIIALPPNVTTCRYLKVPAQLPQEIENIISLQVSTYLPYPKSELITGYQTILVDKEGYSHINMVIAHKDVVERSLRICKELKIIKPKIVLSTYGLCNLYDYLIDFCAADGSLSNKSTDRESIMLVDIDSDQAELAITSRKKLVFSRYFKFNRFQSDWEKLFVDEIQRTLDAYVKEMIKDAPGVDRIIILANTAKASEDFAGVLHTLRSLAQTRYKQITSPIEFLSLAEKMNFYRETADAILNSNNSFSSLIGLGLKDVTESLNLLPSDIKQRNIKITQRKELIRFMLFISGIIFILGLGITKHLDNKALYLERLKIELNKINKEARPLEDMEKRIRMLDAQPLKKPSLLDIIYELHQVAPQQISLISFSCEEDNQIILHGQTSELNSVFVFTSQLEKSTAFKNFNIKVRYATKKGTPSGEMVDFEILCIRK